MLLELDYLFDKYKIAAKGIIQVGCHRAQEFDSYVKHGIKEVVLIEPSQDAFAHLLPRFGSDPRVLLFNTACGDGSEGGKGMAYTEHTNQGQSNSLLAPKVHLTQHKEVIFDGQTQWNVTRLDDLDFDKSLYNFLNMDCQGYEDRVLRGAVETLKSIDYCYSEINRLEMYEKNAMVEDLDNILSEFQRVETGWASDYHGWGDGFYIRKSILNGN